MSQDHSPKIRAALESLEAPPLRDGFHERLWARVDAAERAEARPRRRLILRRPVLMGATALAIGAVCAVLAVVNWTATERLVPVGAPPATAGGVLEKMKASMGSYRSLSAVFYYTRATMTLPETLASDAAAGRLSQRAIRRALRVEPAAAPLLEARVLATSNGRMRTWSAKTATGTWGLPSEGATVWNTPGLHLQVRNIPEGFAYEAWLADGQLQVQRTVETAPGPPDAPSTGWFPGTYGGQISPLAFRAGAVTPISYQGRDALAVDAAVPVGPVAVNEYGLVESPPFDHVRMIVDKATWLPVRVVRTYRGAEVEAWGFEDVRLDVPVHAADFSATLPGSATIEDRNAGFRRTGSLAAAAKAVHGHLFVPTRLPRGFTLELVSVRNGSSGGIPTTPSASGIGLGGTGETPAADIVSLVYRNGFRSIVVTTRAVARAGESTDPFADSAWAAAPRRPQSLPVSHGGMAGESAHVVARTFELPRLWVGDGRTLVTVAGDLTRRELLATGESLQPYEVAQTQTVVDRYQAATRADDRKSLDALFSPRAVLHDEDAMTSFSERREILRRNNDFAANFIDGVTVSTLVGHRWVLWEGWLSDAFAADKTGSATAALLEVRDGHVQSVDFYTMDGCLRPDRLGGHSLDSASTAAAVARSYAAALKAKDAARLAAQARQGVRFMDVNFGDAGGADVLQRRYERMFRRPADLRFHDVHWFGGPGWAVVRWVASSPSVGSREAGLTVLETRDGKVARETIYCSRFKAPFD